MSRADQISALEPRRKRLVFRCWHRGMREMDLILGRYAETHVAGMDEADVARLEALLEASDPDLFAWICGARAAPPEHDTPLLRSIRSYHLNFPTAEDVFHP